MKAGIVSRNGKHRRRGGRSKTMKHYGELRLAKSFNDFHGFSLKPGMFFGVDDDGLFVTRARLKKIWFTGTNGEKYFTLEYPVWRKNDSTGNEWQRIYEPEHSGLWEKMNKLYGTTLKESKYLAEHADYERIERLRADKKAERESERALDKMEQEVPKDVPRQLGMRMSGTNYLYRPLGRPPFPNQFSENGRTEYGIEKHGLDISPIPVFRMQSDYENPQHPYSAAIYTK